MNTFRFARPVRLILGIVTVSGALLGLSACAGVQPTDGSQYLAPGDRPSTIPWNKPESWEGKGQLGNLAGNNGKFGPGQ